MSDRAPTHVQRARAAESALVVATIFVVTLAVNLQVPLYPVYASMAGYGQGLVPLAFAAYVAGLIPVLLLLGGLANRIGNKEVVGIGLSFALLAHVVIISWPTPAALLGMRLLQGISVGLSLAPSTAYLAELSADPARAARLSSVAVTLGLGSGGLLTSSSVTAHSNLVPLSYYGVALATLLCLLAAHWLPKRAPSGVGPLLRVPLLSARSLPFAVAIFVSWSLTGVILALVPAQLALTGEQQWVGLVVFVAIALGGLVQLFPDLRDPRRSQRVGYALVGASLLLMIVAVHRRATGVLFAACALSGFSSFGFTHRGGLTGTMLACREERARALAGYYLFGYVGLGLPCVAVGWLAERTGLEYALMGYAALLVAVWGVSRAVTSALERQAALKPELAAVNSLSPPRIARQP